MHKSETIYIYIYIVYHKSEYTPRVVEEWKSIQVATCEALVNSMPRRVKAVLDNDGGHTKY